MEKTFGVVRTMPRPSARRMPCGRLQGPEEPVFLRQSHGLRQLNGRWGGAWQDAAEALYDYVVQKHSLGLGDKKMVTRSRLDRLSQRSRSTDSRRSPPKEHPGPTGPREQSRAFMATHPPPP